MAILRVQLSLAHTNGLPEDRATNTFHFSTSDVLQTTLDDILNELIAFLDSTPTAGSTALYTFFSDEVAQNGHTFTFYNLDEAEPRQPIYEYTHNLPGDPNGDPLPGEVAICLSFQGTPVSGLSQARRRGRIFFGRLDKDCSTAGRPTDLLRTTGALAMNDLADASDAAGSWTWIVYSRAHTATVKDPRPSYGATFTAVTNGWVDNAFDTQRRRGLAATARTTFSNV